MSADVGSILIQLAGQYVLPLLVEKASRYVAQTARMFPDGSAFDLEQVILDQTSLRSYRPSVIFRASWTQPRIP